MASFEIAHAEQHSQKAQQHRYAAAWAERSLTPLGDSLSLQIAAHGAVRGLRA
jgi:hypothetical protein